MMVNRSNIYAVCRWNQRFSSRGRNRIFGRRKRIKFRHTASIIRNPSRARTSPAPRELHTLYLSVFNSESFVLVTCVYLGVSRDQSSLTIHMQRCPNVILAKGYAKAIFVPSTRVCTTAPPRPSCLE